MFNAKDFIEDYSIKFREKVGEEKVISACSGGVDSTTSTYLVYKIIGNNLLSVFIDDGLRREGEPEFVIKTLKTLGIRARSLDETKTFFDVLKGLTDAEEKRKAFRHKFYSVLGSAIKEEEAKFLVQGTIAADIDETVKGIKTQHNVLEQIGIDPKTYGFEVIEPLKELYKPQVREVARELKLPRDISERMPFPGPALSIRVIGEVNPEKVKIVRKATSIVEEETVDIEAFQSFAVLHSDKATGIKDGKRVYGDIITVRIVSSEKAIIASAVEPPYPVLKRIARRVTSEIPSVVRCLYDLTDKPPATIEFE